MEYDTVLREEAEWEKGRRDGSGIFKRKKKEDLI